MSVDDDVTCLTELRFPVAVMRLCGTLTLSGAATIRGHLLKCLTDQPAALVVDLSELIVADALALTVLPAIAGRAAEWPGTSILLCAPRPEGVAALDRMGVTRYVRVFPTRAEALAVAVRRPAPRRLRQHLLPSTDAPRQARNLVAQACANWDLPADIQPVAQLIATELVSNAVLHAASPIDFSVSLRDRCLHLAVADQSSRPARRRTIFEESAEHGRGLQVVDSMAASWGSVPTPDGKVVWATVRVRPVSWRGEVSD